MSTTLEDLIQWLLKHGQAVASVISSVAIALLYAMVAVDVANQLGLPVGSLVAPAAVLGGALGFGAQRGWTSAAGTHRFGLPSRRRRDLRCGVYWKPISWRTARPSAS